MALIIEAFPGVVSIAGNALDQIAIGFEDLLIRADKPDAAGMISQRLAAHPASERAAIVVRHQEAKSILTYVRFFKPRERY